MPLRASVTLASIIAALLLLSPIFAPLASASTNDQSSVKILSLSELGSAGTVQVSVNGVIYSFTATISNSGSDPTVTSGSSYAVYPEYVGNPSYAAWWNGIGDSPEIYIYLDPATASNVQNAVAGITALLAFLSAIPGINIGVIVAAGTAGLFTVVYSTLYQNDHNSDGGFSLWIPIDWYNLFTITANHDIYVKTPDYWWILLPFAALKV
jgi:hypothetical protein